MTKLTYITNVRMPTEKAHGIQIARMCEAFGTAGIDLELVVPRRKGTNPESAYAFYGIKNNFKIRPLWCIDIVEKVPWFGYWLQLATFTLSVLVRYTFASRTASRLYTREFMLAVLLRRLGYDVVYESHRILLKKKLFFGLLRGVNRIITNSRGVAEEFKANGFKDVLPLPNGIDLAEFDLKQSKAELRRELGWVESDRIALYTGYLYKWKGIDTLMAAGELISKTGSSFKLVILGGSVADVKTYSDIAREKGMIKMEFLGHKDRKVMPKYMKAADVLLLPNSAVSEESVKYTSPIKLFEYMASRVPIVASDMPSIREIVSDESAVLVKPDDAAALVAGIEKTLADEAESKVRAEKAYQDVTELTWDGRAAKTLDFIGLRA
ncbi:MAG: glycosyltransferase family 4 protein [Patescibacteria group bacterium]